MFLETYPVNFASDEALPGLDLASTTLTWHLFRRDLNELYRSFYKRELGQTGNKPSQIRSCFAHPRPVFDEQDTCNRDCPASDSLAENYLVRRQLEFFLPVFILEYNQVKKQLVDTDEKVYSGELKNYSSKIAMLESGAIVPGELAEPLRPDNSGRFLHGTAKSIREQLNSSPTRAFPNATTGKRSIRRKRDDEDGRDALIDDCWAVPLRDSKARRVLFGSHTQSNLSFLVAGGEQFNSAERVDPGNAVASDGGELKLSA